MSISSFSPLGMQFVCLRELNLFKFSRHGSCLNQPQTLLHSLNFAPHCCLVEHTSHFTKDRAPSLQLNSFAFSYLLVSVFVSKVIISLPPLALLTESPLFVVLHILHDPQLSDNKCNRKMCQSTSSISIPSPLDRKGAVSEETCLEG